MNIMRPLLAGAGIYLILELAGYIGEIAGDRVSSEITLSILGIGTLLGLFLPGLVAGSLARSRPLWVGCALGGVVSVIYVALSVFFLGWDWALAGIRLSPLAIPLLFAATLAFTYGGHLASKRVKSARSDAVT